MPEFSIQIDAPPEMIFDELSHVERHPSWANPKAQMTMQKTMGDGPGASATYRSSGVFTGKSVSADISVTRFDPPREFSIRSDQHQEGKTDAWYENDYTLRQDGSGTVVTKHVTGSLSPVVFALAHFAIRKDAMTSLRNLKQVVEAKAATGGTV
ncbi:MAG TPA: SRPBCC family protein [Actinomycetota bacterium]